MRDDAVIDGDALQVALSATRQLDDSRMDSAETLSMIVSGAVDAVPGAEHAGVSLVYRDGAITSAATSSSAVDDVDQLQVVHREGPCVTALWDEHTVLVEDLAAESARWPAFAPQATARGVASMLSFQLFTRVETLGALNLYSGHRGSFTVESQSLGGLFAAHAATALGESRHIEQLYQALVSRDVIGQAKGVLMERFGVGAEAAFQLLVRSSQETNMKLVAVARWLTGSIGEPASEG